MSGPFTLPGAPLPIDPVLPELCDHLAARGVAVLQAPPGAGKTTRVPLALLNDPRFQGRILMLEPRRVAARASAERMAAVLGEPVGQTIGYRMRGDSKTSAQTRVEVITDGILTRMIQSDPDLSDIGTILFDEFHERSLSADLGLALTLDLRAALREDLRVLVMSATLQAAPVAQLLGDAPVVTSEGRSFPVETLWLDKPLGALAGQAGGPGTYHRDQARLRAVADLTQRALAETEGGVLVFLPGAGEIRRVTAMLSPVLPSDVSLFPLYGALSAEGQRGALAPLKVGRKLVLATSIAETSLTIDGIRTVVDAGLARRARFMPSTGMGGLVTERVSRAEADQRRGRAGRVAPGWCYRLWTKAEEGALPADPPPEIATADLAGLALDLAAWGAAPEGLSFLTQPPDGAWAEAVALCRDLGALDAAGLITPHGRAMAEVPLHPRLAHMLLCAGPGAAPLAALLSSRPFGGQDVSLLPSLQALSDQRHRLPPEDERALKPVRAEIPRLKRLAKSARPTPDLAEVLRDPAAQAALAYPDRIGLRRKGSDPRWVLSGGRGAVMRPEDPLAAHRLLVVTDLDGIGRDARIRGALPLTEADLRALFPNQIVDTPVCDWDARTRRVRARRQERLGALVLADVHWTDAPSDALSRAALDGVRAMGLTLSGPAARLAARVECARADGADLPAMDEAHLLEEAEDWLLPWLDGVRSAEAIATLDLVPALQARLGWAGQAELDRLMPPVFLTPLGRKVPIDYDSDPPGIAVKLQELFGQTSHPSVLGGAVRLKVSLLSPAGRPLAVTADLPGFWQGAYADVRKDMRGRYPRHPWPEDPTQADPTTRAKPRGT